MSVEVRGARIDDYEEIRKTVNDAFENTDDEVGIWDSLVAKMPSFTPDCARVAIVDRVPVALTVVVPRSVKTRSKWVEGAEITLVCCRKAYQGRGYGSAVVQDALSYMKERELAAGVFYGEPDYYPRFGCAPVFSRFTAVLAVEAYRKQASMVSSSSCLIPTVAFEPGVVLRPAVPEDAPTLAKLYLKDLGGHPGAVSRSAQAWEWTPRDTSHWQVWMLSDGHGYAAASPSKSGDFLYVNEAGVFQHVHACRLLEGLMSLAEEFGKPALRISLPPTNPLYRVMFMLGAECTVHAARPGFAVVTDWRKILPPDYERTPDGLSLDGRSVLVADTIPLTQLVMGYRDIDDILLLAECSVQSEPTIGRLRQDFPRLTPFYVHAPFYNLY